MCAYIVCVGKTNDKYSIVHPGSAENKAFSTSPWPSLSLSFTMVPLLFNWMALLTKEVLYHLQQKCIKLVNAYRPVRGALLKVNTLDSIGAVKRREYEKNVFRGEKQHARLHTPINKSMRVYLLSSKRTSTRKTYHERTETNVWLEW